MKSGGRREGGGGEVEDWIEKVLRVGEEDEKRIIFGVLVKKKGGCGFDLERLRE